MTILTHAISGARYTLEDSGLVRVENNGLTGWFTWDGRHERGDLRQADVHMLVWIAGPQLPADAAVRKNR